MTLILDMVILGLGIAGWIAVVVLARTQRGRYRRLMDSLTRGQVQQAEIELDAAIDRVLLTGGDKWSVGRVRDQAIALLSSVSESVLRAEYGSNYEQIVGQRIEGRRR